MQFVEYVGTIRNFRNAEVAEKFDRKAIAIEKDWKDHNRVAICVPKEVLLPMRALLLADILQKKNN